MNEYFASENMLITTVISSLRMLRRAATPSKLSFVLRTAYFCRRDTPHDRYRKKPVVINAIRWQGGDYECLNNFCGKNWTRADVVDMGYEDAEQVVLWNVKEKQYLHCPVGHWIIRGVAGELYPCAPDIFAATYEQDNACQECNGTGRKLFKTDPGTASVEGCKSCNATGYIDQRARCPKCGREYGASNEQQ